jgi:hypothetical protein
MTEFNDRIAIQRHILALVNRRAWSEELFGLSSKAIERWAVSNGLRMDSRLVFLIREASAQLLALATRSQETVSERYVGIREGIAARTNEIEEALFEVEAG